MRSCDFLVACYTEDLFIMASREKEKMLRNILLKLKRFGKSRTARKKKKC
jgi:hypothetical protein